MMSSNSQITTTLSLVIISIVATRESNTASIIDGAKIEQEGFRTFGIGNTVTKLHEIDPGPRERNAKDIQNKFKPSDTNLKTVTDTNMKTVKSNKNAIVGLNGLKSSTGTGINRMLDRDTAAQRDFKASIKGKEHTVDQSKSRPPEIVKKLSSPYFTNIPTGLCPDGMSDYECSHELMSAWIRILLKEILQK